LLVNALDLFKHVLSFAAPALAVALVVTLAGRWLLPRSSPGRAGWVFFAINSVAGLAALGAGLWYFGRDGKMASYAAMVLAVATAQWLAGRAWRG
jgi:lipopolysaccharide export LptBFGC system permease protein LptF